MNLWALLTEKFYLGINPILVVIQTINIQRILRMILVSHNALTKETLKWWEREEEKIYASFAAATKTINYTELEWGDFFFREAIVQTYFHIVNECERKGIRIYHIWCCCWLHWPLQCTSTDNEKKELKPFLGTKMECVHVWFVHLCHYLIDSWTSSCILHTSSPRMEWTKHETAYLTLKSMFLQKRTSKVNLHSISHTFNRFTWFLVFCLLNSRKTHLKESFP